MRLWLYGSLILTCCILVGCAATSGPEVSNNGVAGQEGEEAAPKVLVPYGEYQKLIRAKASSDGALRRALYARAEYSLDGREERVEFQAKLFLICPPGGSIPFQPFSCRQATLKNMTVRPAGAASVQMSEEGPTLTLHKEGYVTVELTCHITPRNSLIKFATAPFALATISIPDGRGFVTRGGQGATSRKGRRYWMVEKPKSKDHGVPIEILYEPQGGPIDLTKPQLAHVATVLSTKKDKLFFQSTIQGVGLSENGGEVTILIDKAAANIKVEGDGQLKQEVGKADELWQAYVIELDEKASSPWSLSLQGSLALTTKTVYVDFRPPVPAREMLPKLGEPIRKSPWLGGLIALAEMGPRRLQLEKGLARLPDDWWEVTQRERIDAFVKGCRYEGQPRRLLEYRTRRPTLPLRVSGLQARYHGLLRIVTALAADTRIESAYGGGETYDSLVTTAKYELSSGEGPFKFSLPSRSNDLSVSINGTRKSVEKDGNNHYLVEFSDEKEQVVSVEYTIQSTPLAGSLGAFDMALPAINLPNMATNWSVQLPSDHEPYEVNTSLVSPVQRPPFFLTRVGLFAIDYLLAAGKVGMALVSSVYERIAGPLASTGKTPQGTMAMKEEDKASAKEETAEITIQRSGSFEPVKIELKSGFMAASLNEGKKDEVLPLPPKATIYSVSKSFSFPIWLSAFILGMLVFAYIWMFANGVPPMEPQQALPALVLVLFLFDWYFPFATGGAACSFFFITGGLGAFRLTAYIEMQMRIAQLRQIALQEAGTIGDLEGQGVFFATRKKRNIIRLSELFEDDDEDEDDGIMFFAPDGPKDEEGGDQ